MSVKRKRYSKQFQLDALQMFENGPRSLAEVERELGLTAGLLGKWRDELQQTADVQDAFRGNGNLPEKDARIRQLERENNQLRHGLQDAAASHRRAGGRCAAHGAVRTPA